MAGWLRICILYRSPYLWANSVNWICNRLKLNCMFPKIGNRKGPGMLSKVVETLDAVEMSRTTMTIRIAVTRSIAARQQGNSGILSMFTLQLSHIHTA